MTLNLNDFTVVVKAVCPTATKDVVINLKNREKAIKSAAYGPLNPDEPNTEFWKEKAQRWEVTTAEAKKSLCGNCAVFIQTKDMLNCIDKGLTAGDSSRQNSWDSIKAGDLGYCEAFDFKCAAARTCDAWVAGGPITKSEVEKATESTLRDKAKEHNDSVGDNESKRTSAGVLQQVYNRGVGAYKTNPSSVRPNVSSEQQWAMGRVNGFLHALKTGRFKSGSFDTDLLPEGHPRSSKGQE